MQHGEEAQRKEDSAQMLFRDEYRIKKTIGEGTFSTVHLAEDRNKELVAVKLITRTSIPKRIANELKILMALKGAKNVVEILHTKREENDVYMVFPYIRSTPFNELIEHRTIEQVRRYMYELLTALKSVHQAGIIHRDVKPNNFMYSAETGRGTLIDFGLSQEIEVKEDAEVREKKRKFFFSAQNVYRTEKERHSVQHPPGYIVKDARPGMTAPRSGTRGFRAPEVLFRVQRQSTAIDVWSAGIMFLMLLSKKYPFFEAKNDINALVELGTVYGDKEMCSAAKYYKRVWKSNIKECMQTRKTYKCIVQECTRDKSVPDDAYDLLDRMLQLKASERITAEDALRHRFFAHM